MTDIRNTTVTVKYSCDECGIKDRAVQVSERQTSEDATDYIWKAAGVVGADHNAESPQCTATHITEMKIPHHDDIVGAEGDEHDEHLD